MKLIIIIDCGTTNTKLHIVENETCMDNSYIHMGIKDLVSNEQKQQLKEIIKTALQDRLKKLNRTFDDICCLIGFGMLTSELGLFDVPHLTAPVSPDEIKQNIQIIYDDFLPLIPIFLIPGVKNRIDLDASPLKSLSFADFMRGEETQIAGVMDIYKPKSAFNVIVLSSHTKLIHINKNHQIHSSYTTVCGQLYQAINENTSMGKSLKDDQKPAMLPPADVINFAEKVSTEQGFLRGVMITRFLDTLMETSAKDRRLFLDALMSFEDLKILDLAQKNSVNLDVPYFLIGHKDHADIFETILKRKTENLEIHKIVTEQQKAAINVAGAILLTEKPRRKK